MALEVAMTFFPKNVPMEKYANQMFFHADSYPLYIYFNLQL